MQHLTPLFLLLACAQALVHYLFVGTTDGSWIYTLSLSDETKRASYVGATDSMGATSSLVLDVSKFSVL